MMTQNSFVQRVQDTLGHIELTEGASSYKTYYLVIQGEKYHG